MRKMQRKGGLCSNEEESGRFPVARGGGLVCPHIPENENENEENEHDNENKNENHNENEEEAHAMCPHIPERSLLDVTRR